MGARMLERATPPGLMWPSIAAERFLELSRKSEAILKGDPGFKQQYQFAREKLLDLLGAERIRSVFVVSSDGTQRALPGRFWSSNQQFYAWHREYSTVAFPPIDQRWQFDQEGLGYSILGCAFVDLKSLHDFFERPSEASSAGLLPPEDHETMQDYIIRALNLPGPQNISIKDARRLAEVWLQTRRGQSDRSSIERLANSFTASMRGLSRVDTKPKLGRKKPKL